MELQTDVIEKKTFALLKKLMNEEILSEYFLVGGTALALRLGHRKSIDIDMFTRQDIDVAELQKFLTEKYDFREEFRSKNTLKGDISGIKVDLIKYDYPFLKELEKTEDNIRIASNEDIIAMKLSAITDSGTRVKDFTDISYLSKDFSLNEMLEFYNKKFNGANIFSVAKALVYFDDIDFSNEPVELLDAVFEWETVKNRLFDMVRNPEKRFATFPIQKKTLKKDFTKYIAEKDNTADNFFDNLSVKSITECVSPIDFLDKAEKLISSMAKEEKKKCENLCKKVCEEKSCNFAELFVNIYTSAISETPEKFRHEMNNDILARKGDCVFGEVHIGDNLENITLSKNIKLFGLNNQQILKCDELKVIAASKKENFITVMDENKSYFDLPYDVMEKSYYSNRINKMNLSKNSPKQPKPSKPKTYDDAGIER